MLFVLRCIEKMNDQHAEHCRQAEREGSVESLPSRISSASPEQSSAPLENLALPADSGPASDTMNGISPFANYPTPSSLRQNSRSGSLPPSNADYTGDASAQRYGSPHASHKSRTPDPTLLSSYIDDFVVSMNDTGEYESEAVLASIEAEGELEGGSSYAEMEAFAQKPFEEPQGWTLNAAARTFFPFLGGNKPSDEQEDEHEETVPQSINPSDIMAPTPPLSRRAESPSRRTTEQEEVSSQQTTVAPNLLSPVRPAYDAESESTDHSQGLPSTSALPYETNGHDAAQISSHGTTASSDSFDLYKIFPSYREAEDSIFNAFDADKLPLKVKWRPSELSPGLRDASYECMYECGYTVNLMDDQKGQWRVTGVEGAHRPSCYEGGRSKNANKRTTGRKKSRPWGAPARRRTRPKKVSLGRGQQLAVSRTTDHHFSCPPFSNQMADLGRFHLSLRGLESVKEKTTARQTPKMPSRSSRTLQSTVERSGRDELHLLLRRTKSARGECRIATKTRFLRRGEVRLMGKIQRRMAWRTMMSRS